MRFSRNICIKAGVAFLMSFTDYVQIGPFCAFLACIGLITVSTYIAEKADAALCGYINMKIIFTGDLLLKDIVIYFTVILAFLIILPMAIMYFTHGILVENTLTSFVVAVILWVLGYVPKAND